MTLEHSGPEPEIVVLPASALWTGNRRIDAEAYLAGGYGSRLRVAALEGSRPFASYAEVWMPGRLTAVLVDRSKGVPFVTATQAFDTRPLPRKFLASAKTRNLPSYFVEPGWIIVTRSGTVGDALTVYQPHMDVAVSDDLLRVVPHDPMMRGYLYGFLRSRIGRAMLRSNQYGSIVKHLEPAHLRAVPVPPPTPALVADAEQRVADMIAMRTSAYALTLRSEAAYERALGYDPTPRDTSQFSVRSSAMWSGRRRIEAYHWNPAAAAVMAAVASRAEPLARVTQRVFGVPRFKHIYAENGVPYVDSEDLFKVNPEATKFIPTVSAKARETYFVQRDWLLMASSGQLYGLNGSTVLATAWHEGKVVSNHANRIVPGPRIRPGYLQMALGHPSLGRPLVLRLAFGSEVPEIAPDDLKTVPIARLDDGDEAAIATDVEEASRLRYEADRLEQALADEIDRALM